MSKMLNLKLYGGFYKFNCGPYVDYAGYVVSKSVHDEKTHVYLVIFPNEKGYCASCIYLWDTGRANQGYDNFLSRSIVKCEEMTPKEKEEMYHKFTMLGQAGHVWLDDPVKCGVAWRMKELKRISWLNSASMPARIHLTRDNGETTLCGHSPRSEKNWKITDKVPRKIRGVSRYCRVCFKSGGKNLPFITE